MGLDSVELLMLVEKHFSISIPDAEAEKAYTIGKLVDCVAKILNVTAYDFSLRENTFASIKKEILDLKSYQLPFKITDKVSNSLDVEDKDLIIDLENRIGLKFPGIDTSATNTNSLLLKLKHWFNTTASISFEQITWKKYVDIMLAENLYNLSKPLAYTSKYEIYIAIMRITVDKIGIDYEEIGIGKSFTDDLGVD